MWAATMPADERVFGAPLAGDTHADVTVVGAGLTGLWTAYYLALADPSLRIVVVDAATIGFGASGRNGGWCSALLPMSLSSLAKVHGRHSAIGMYRAMQSTIDEVERVLVAEGRAADFAKGGTITLARRADQVTRLHAELAEHRRFGFDESDVRWLGAAEAAESCHVTDGLGGLFTPHCAALHPLRLVHAVAAAAAAKGVEIKEHTTVEDVTPGRVQTARGRVRTEVVVLATEAYTSRLPDRKRQVLPLYSLMVASDPLTDEQWSQIGLAHRTTFADGRHLLIYGQRTADGRLAFGGRGAPYHFGSRIEDRFDTDAAVRDRLVEAVQELFPVLAGVPFPFHWGGPLGVPRDWHSSVAFDLRTRMASAGGYVGDGVATANLAGRTLAELITGQPGALAELPWVGYHSRAWEPEPLRWLGVNAGRVAAGRADRAESGLGALAAPRARAWRRTLGLLSGR